MEGSQTDWHCEMLNLLGCLCSRNRFCSCLAIAPNRAPAQEKLSCHLALLSSGDVTLGTSAMLLSTVWGSNWGRMVRDRPILPAAGVCSVDQAYLWFKISLQTEKSVFFYYSFFLMSELFSCLDHCNCNFKWRACEKRCQGVPSQHCFIVAMCKIHSQFQ